MVTLVTVDTYEAIVGPNNNIQAAFDFSGGLPGAPVSGQGWLARIGGSGVTQGNLAAFFNGAWYQAPPIIGTTYKDATQAWLIDIDNTIVPLDVIMAESDAAFTTIIGINTFLGFSSSVAGIGSFTAGLFFPADAGNYSIQYRITGGGANSISVELVSSVKGTLASGVCLGVGQPAGCTFSGRLELGESVSLRYNSTLVQAGLTISVSITKTN